MNQQGQDLMMGAPAEVRPTRLKELHIRLDLPPVKRPPKGPPLKRKRVRRGPRHPKIGRSP